METISKNKDNNFSTWEALKDYYLNKGRKITGLYLFKFLKLRLKRFWFVYTKSIPRNGETLLKRFYDLI